MTSDILTRIEGHAGIISLNRPSAIHALTLDMVHAMTEALQGWRKSRKVKCIIIDHAEGRGFCAGGDIAFLRDSALHDGGAAGRQFFHDEYRLNHLLLPIPSRWWPSWTEITMGGGVAYRSLRVIVLQPKTPVLAMPETGIGLFPILAVAGISRGWRGGSDRFWR